MLYLTVYTFFPLLSANPSNPDKMKQIRPDLQKSNRSLYAIFLKLLYFLEFVLNPAFVSCQLAALSHHSQKTRTVTR